MNAANHYSTATVAPGERFAYWREAVCETYVRLGCDVYKPTEFSGELAISRYTNVAISQVSGTAHSVARRKRDIRADSEDSFIVSIQTSHTSRVTQFGNTAILKPGDMVIYDSTQPYRLDLCDGFSQTVLQFPKQQVLSRLPNAGLLGGVRIDGQGGIGQTISQSITQISAQLDNSDPLLAGLLENTLMDLVASGLASHLPDTTLELSSPEQHILMRARVFIGANLDDPNLNRNTVAESVGLSVRRLNEIFARENTSIAGEIRTRRLETAAADLIDTRFIGLSISEIAIRRGFSNLQHFSTLFRRHFDCSPKAYRSKI